MATLRALYNLAHSLTKSEKRTLNIHLENLVSKGKDNYTLQLNNIYAVSKYDEDTLKIKMQNISTKRLSEFNSNLFKLITKVLSQHLIESTPALDLQQQIMNIEVLIKKGIYDEANKLIEQTLKKYENYNYSELIAYLLKLKYKVSMKKFSSFENVINLQQDKIGQAEISINESEYLKLNFQLSKLYSEEYFPRNTQQLAKFKELLNHPLLLDISCAKSNYAKHYYYMIKIPLLTINNDTDICMNIAKAAIKFTKENFNKKIDPFPQIFQLRRYLNTLITLKIPNDLIETAEEINKLIPYLPTTQNKNTLWSNILDAHLHKFLIDKDYEAGVSYFEKEAKTTFDANLSQLNRLDSKALLIARLYFLTDEFDKSLKYCEIALQGEQYKFISFVIAAKFLTLMNHYKMGNSLLLPYVVKSLRRSLNQENQLYKPEKALLAFLGKVENIDSMKSALEKLKVTLNKEHKDPLNSPFFSNGDYLLWIDSELAGS